MTLSNLIRKGGLAQIATATPATLATQETTSAATVATVATVAVANPVEAKTAPPSHATPWPAELTADLRRVAETFEWSRDDVRDFIKWARQSPRALADATAFLHGELARLPPPEPEGAAWCRAELAEDPTLRVVWRVDDCATDPVRVWLAIRGKGVGVVAIPRERFGVWSLERLIGDIAAPRGKQLLACLNRGVAVWRLGRK